MECHAGAMTDSLAITFSLADAIWATALSSTKHQQPSTVVVDVDSCQLYRP